MVSEKEFHKILEGKGVIKNCRDIWWEHWNQHQIKFGGSIEALENLVSAAVKNGCKAPCGL